MTQKTLRKAIIALHILSLVLAMALLVVGGTKVSGKVQFLLAFLLAFGILIDLSLMIGYFRKSREMESDLSKSQVELLQQQLYSNEDKLNALQSQINPHFLYNTMETIREMALEHGEVELSRIISSLSLMFRYSMDFSNTVVPLEHELAQVKRYMKLQQLRFPNRFELNLINESEEEDLQHILIPKFTVQPLVENAVKHGFHNMREGCVLNIRLMSDGNMFKVLVEDNGKGMEPEMVQSMNESVQLGKTRKSEDPSSNGIALSNIYSRLRLYFGEQADTYVYSSVGVGTIVTIDFPIKRNA